MPGPRVTICFSLSLQQLRGEHDISPLRVVCVHTATSLHTHTQLLCVHTAPPPYGRHREAGVRVSSDDWLKPALRDSVLVPPR
jgi:hypothetical protein